MDTDRKRYASRPHKQADMLFPGDIIAWTEFTLTVDRTARYRGARRILIVFTDGTQTVLPHDYPCPIA